MSKITKLCVETFLHIIMIMNKFCVDKFTNLSRIVKIVRRVIPSLVSAVSEFTIVGKFNLPKTLIYEVFSHEKHFLDLSA